MPYVLLLLVVLLLWECSALLLIRSTSLRVIFACIGGAVFLGLTTLSRESFFMVFGHVFYFGLYSTLLVWFILWADWSSLLGDFWEARKKNKPPENPTTISLRISTASRKARVLLSLGCLVVLVALCIAFYGLHMYVAPGILIYVLGVAWATDTGAYFVGRSFGKRPLSRRVSPKKTVEGTIGGFLLGVILALIVGFLWIQPELGWSNVGVVAMSFVVPITAVVGDLLESILKRISDAKDSGSILPGHGGLLDRIDSLVIAAPSMFTASTLFGNFSA